MIFTFQLHTPQPMQSNSEHFNDVLIMFALSRMNVEDANKKLKAEKGIATDEVTDASDIN